MVSVLGIVGPIGSGKDTAADYIAEKYGYTIFSFRDAVAEATEKEGLEADRENLQRVSREMRDRLGENVFAEIVLGKVTAADCEKALVKEMRTAGDIRVIKGHFGDSMKIIKVAATEALRFERLRNRRRTGDPLTLEEFRLQEKGEEELGYTKAFNFTDFTVFNNGSKEELYRQIDAVMENLNKEARLVKKRFFG